MKKILLSSFIFCCLLQPALTLTLISDKQKVYGKWAKSNSPYIVLGEAIVPEGRTLTIEPGVVVKFKAGTHYNYTKPDFDLGFLRVNGQINANGTNKEWITFTRLGDNGYWGSVIIDDQKSNTTISHCIFEYGDEVCKSRDKEKVGGSDSYSVLAIHNSINKIMNCIFYNNNSWVLSLDNSNVQVEHCTFYNYRQRNIYNSGSDINVKNSILWSGPDADGWSGGKTHIEYCLIKGTLEKTTISTNNIFDKEPMFRDIKNKDFSLQANSPCIGTGKNGVDIGAIPYKTSSITSFNTNYFHDIILRNNQKLNYQKLINQKLNNLKSDDSDSIAPKITINSPKNNFKTLSNNIICNGKAQDVSGIFQVLINNSVATLKSNGNFSATVELTKIGTNPIKIQATDNKLNTKTKTINVIREEKQAVYEKRLALIIGNADYQKNVGDLRNPINDGRDMRDKLESMYFEVMEYENLTYPQMRNAISQYGKKLKNYEVGLVYYSGHGLASKGENYLIPTDAVLNYEEIVSTECVSQNYILSQMEGAGSAVNIIILDACRNNPFLKSWSKGLTDTEWASVTAPSGTFIAYATSPQKEACDGLGNNGAYTAELLKYIDIPGLTIEQVFKKVRSAIDYKFQNLRFKQMPWESTSLKGEFYFIKK